MWTMRLLRLFHTLVSILFKDAIEFGLVCHVHEACNVKDVGITQHKFAEHPTLCGCCYKVVAAQPEPAVATVS